MKPREGGGVVDSRLNVHGVQGLKVAGQFKLTVPPWNVLTLHIPLVDVRGGRSFLNNSPLTSVLKISICPANVGANTYSTALVIGEKAAIIIAEELGIKGV